MHRVELKGLFCSSDVNKINNIVPNAPCGVESWARSHNPKNRPPVPNAPCGVESHSDFFVVCIHVNLKVPNAPCGVESILTKICFEVFYMFLMHRVELKADWRQEVAGTFGATYRGFLMHRVELKVLCRRKAS